MYSPTPPVGAFLFAGLIEPFGKRTCIAGPFERSTGGEAAARFEAGTAALFSEGDAEVAQAVEGIDSTSCTFPAPQDHLFAPRAVLTFPEKSLGIVQDGRVEVEEGVEAGTREDVEGEDSVETGEAVTVAVSSSMTVEVKRIVEVTVIGAAV